MEELFKKAGKKAWLIISALLNAMSILNIGKDLKMSFFELSYFLEISLNFYNEIASFLIKPFSLFFSLFAISIPVFIRSYYVIISLIITVVSRAHFEANEIYKKGSDSNVVKRSLRDKATILIVQVLSAFFLGFLFSMLIWAGAWLMGKYIHFLVILPLFFLFWILLRSKSRFSNSYEKYRFEKIQIYFRLVAYFTIGLFLLNFIIVTFTEA